MNQGAAGPAVERIWCSGIVEDADTSVMNVLFLMHAGTNSRCVLIDILEGFKSAGHKTFAWEIGDAVNMMVAQPQQRAGMRAQVMSGMAQLIAQHQIDLVVGMWANAMSLVEHRTLDGRVMNYFESIKCPHLMIWYDSPERVDRGALRGHFQTGLFNSPYLFHYINNTETAREMERVYGFSNVLPRGYGINPAVFHPSTDNWAEAAELQHRPYDLVFCGSGGNLQNPPQSVLDELIKEEPDAMLLRLEAAKLHWPAFQQCVRFLPDIVTEPQRMHFLHQLMQGQLDHREAPLLDRVQAMGAAPGLTGALAGLMLADPTIYANIASSLREMEQYDRAFLFTYLSRYFKCRLFGAVDYTSLGCRVTSDGPVEYAQQAEIYQSARIGLSVMRWQDERGLHVKPYEMTASGLACVAQHRPGIEDHFTAGEEIETFTNFSDARKLITALLTDVPRLAALTRRGRKRTLASHTWAEWTRDITGEIQQRLPRTDRAAA